MGVGGGIMEESNIRFSHNYPKLWGQKTAMLIEVRIVQKENLSPLLVEYDTYWNDNLQNKWENSMEICSTTVQKINLKPNCYGYYPLPKGTLLQLIFLGDKGIPFCTLRRHTPQKERYYQSRVGFMFDISIIQDAPNRKNTGHVS
jgi:hypothetical protein